MAHSTAAGPPGALEQGCPIRVEHDRRRRQFTVRLNGCHDRAVLLYEYVGKRTVDLQHTEVPDAYRGRGIAKHLAKLMDILDEVYVNKVWPCLPSLALLLLREGGAAILILSSTLRLAPLLPRGKPRNREVTGGLREE
ncbi:protein NATD1 isoform X1 [Loxodonta africana]|uniref:protein NATD1 isoform X1 n=1 Tax=Elephas maximus indicus TaxID=99487 RepID=UPI00211689F1|nr:protein NATD1 isoform X1 [Elephas maximus indicus]